ncbi:uncharacterized protein LOC124888801 [Capsicum annuum]|uniref:uncharacterized protein LOC124888801 n=1 Tax=Capsicum annuum TaxID=4072 RepID=UPI001FB06823|nr:uncharacterized protein LOC124888801 [Capsicum annuum]
MDYAGVETSPQQFSPTVDQNLSENHDVPDELLQSISLDYNLSEKIVHHDVRITDEKVDQRNLFDSQFTIPDDLLPSLNAYRRESIMTHPSTTREEEPSVEHFNDKKSESVVQDHCQENKENVGSSSKPDMHGEVDLGTEEQILTTPKIQELTTDEQRDEPIWHDSQNTISDELLPSLNVYSSKSIIVHPSRELQTPVHKLQIRKPSKFKESSYMMKFGSAAESSAGHIRIFPQKHPFVYHPIDGIVDTKIQIDICFYYLTKKSKYDPNRSYKFSTVDCNFMNIIRSVHDVYSVDDANLTAGGQATHLNEYINEFRMYAAVPWHTVEDIYIPCDFYVKKGIDVENHPRYKDKDSLDVFDVLFQENLPQQPSESLVPFYGHKVLANEFDPNALRIRYAALLWDYGNRK